jgi:hypothetical protein
MARRPIYLKVTRMGPYTRSLTPPADFFRRRRIDENYEAEWTEEDDGTVRLKFVKIQPEPSPAMANG